MRKNFIFILTSVSFIWMTACNNSGSDKSKAGETQKEEVSNQITFKVDGQAINTSCYNTGRFEKNKKRGLRLISNMNQTPQAINIDINGLKPGTYKFVSGKAAEKDSTGAYGSYFPEYVKDMNNNYFFESGEITITSIDTVKMLLNGSFSGKATNTKKQSVVITEGRVINGKIEPVIYKY